MAFSCDLPGYILVYSMEAQVFAVKLNTKKRLDMDIISTFRGEKNILGVKNHSIEQIVNSDNYPRIRREMLAGKYRQLYGL